MKIEQIKRSQQINTNIMIKYQRKNREILYTKAIKANVIMIVNLNLEIYKNSKFNNISQGQNNKGKNIKILVVKNMIILKISRKFQSSRSNQMLEIKLETKIRDLN